MEAGVGPAAGAERVAAADKSQLHRPQPRFDLSPARGAEQPRQQPDRDHDHGAEQEVAPQPVDRVEAEIPEPLEQQADAAQDFQGSKPIAASTTPTRIDSRISRNATASGEPPRKRDRLSLLAGKFSDVVRHRSLPRKSATLSAQRRHMGNPSAASMAAVLRLNCQFAVTSSASAPASPAGRPRAAACPSAAG